MFVNKQTQRFSFFDFFDRFPIDLKVGAKICSDICPRTLSVPRSSQFSLLGTEHFPVIQSRDGFRPLTCEGKYLLESPVLHSLKSGEKLGTDHIQHGGQEWTGRFQSWRGKK